MRFSPSVGTCYPVEIEYKELPEDLVEITEEEFSAYLNRAPGETVGYDSETGKLIIHSAPVATVEQIRESAISELESAVESAIMAGVNSNARALEYDLTAAEATAFKSAGYVGEAPRSVSIWAQIQNISAQEACDQILFAREQYVNLLLSIREVRLQAKADIAAAADEAAIASIKETAIDALTQIAAQAASI